LLLLLLLDALGELRQLVVDGDRGERAELGVRGTLAPRTRSARAAAGPRR
jgi:hypothetical protein